MSDENFRELERAAETDPVAAKRYIRMLKRVPHLNLVVIAEITGFAPESPMRALAERVLNPQYQRHYTWRKVAGSGPCEGLASEINGADPMDLSLGIGTKLILTEAEGEFYFAWFISR